MKYLKDQMKTLQKIKNENKLSNTEKEALSVMLACYNKVYRLAFRQQNYIKRKQKEWIEQMNSNFELIKENRILEEENLKYRRINRLKNEDIIKLNQKIKELMERK